MERVQATTDMASTTAEQTKRGPRLQDLIPIVMVIVGGCEPCAEKTVTRALQERSSWEDIDETLRIVANVQKLDCFARAVGPEVVERMDKPLAAGRRTLLAASMHAAA
jgi:alkylhydroperoxidase/carboxymuconolactone decarboxylase family protein YurZ